MTTMDAPMVSAFKAFRRTRQLRQNERATHATSTQAVLGVIVRTAMHLAGFSCLTAAGFTLSMTAGLITAGVSFFAFSALMVPSKNQPEVADPMLRR
jgi:hypothetical protein